MIGRRGLLVGGALAACGRARRGAVTLVVYEPGLETFIPEALRGRVEARPLDPPPASGERARTVVVAGHSLPPLYLGRSAGQLARAVSLLGPELVVLDTCFGASLPILAALAHELPGVFAVAAPFWIRASGLLYGEGFFGDGPCEARAAAVRSSGPRPLFRARLDAGALETAGKARPPNPELEAPGLARLPFGAAGDLLVVVNER